MQPTQYMVIMNIKTSNRLVLTLILLVFVSLGTCITLYFLSDNIVFFIIPSEISEKHLGKKIRIGGLVQPGSVQKQSDWITTFIISDGKKSMRVKYKGNLPTLFRESQGIVAEGILEGLSEIFNARILLTKHDETYKPPQIEQ